MNAPIAARQKLAGILETLCTQFDRNLDQGKPVIQNKQWQLTEAINCTRSRALQTLVSFGWWIRRHEPDSAVPEVTTILEKRFNRGTGYELTLPEYAILGTDYGRLLGLDEEWATRHKADFFPQQSLPEWLEAFGYFLHCQPSTPVFNRLRSDYEFALQHLNRFTDQEFSHEGPVGRLGQHLLNYYWWDMYPLTGKDSLLERYYQKTDSDRDRWARLFDHAGRSLENTDKLENSITERVTRFFDWRLHAEEPGELQEFTHWLRAGCLDLEWRLEAYSQTLDIATPDNVATHIQLEALHGMLAEHTPKVVECLAKLTDRLPTDMTYIPTEHAKPILQTGLASSNEDIRYNAEHARENLLRRGLIDLP